MSGICAEEDLHFLRDAQFLQGQFDTALDAKTVAKSTYELLRGQAVQAARTLVLKYFYGVGGYRLTLSHATHQHVMLQWQQLQGKVKDTAFLRPAVEEVFWSRLTI